MFLNVPHGVELQLQKADRLPLYGIQHPLGKGSRWSIFLLRDA
jgi:hypothetical protein